MCICISIIWFGLSSGRHWAEFGDITTKERDGARYLVPLFALWLDCGLLTPLCCYSNCWQFISCNSGFYKVITLCFHPFRLGMITVDTQIHLVPNILIEFLIIEYQFSNLNSLKWNKFKNSISTEQGSPLLPVLKYITVPRHPPLPCPHVCE